MKDLDHWDAQVRAAQTAKAPARLAQIYHQLGLQELDQDKPDAGAFLLVQAYVYALEAGDERAQEIHQILKQMGREE